MGRTLASEGLAAALVAGADDPHWDDVGSRCLACTGCTLVCPTCFCTSVDDATPLGGEVWERWRTWDSCFTASFSYVHGGPVRVDRRPTGNGPRTLDLGGGSARPGAWGADGASPGARGHRHRGGVRRAGARPARGASAVKDIAAF
jgi:ferredoxin